MSNDPFRRMIGLLLVLPVLAAAQTPPEAFLGHRVGDDRKLADAGQILEYFRLLDHESPELELVTIGESVGKKPLVMAVISSEENLAGIGAILEAAKKLKEARGLSPEDARAIARYGKVLLLVAGSLHADEIAASQMSMELAYDLVTGRTPWDAGRTLEDVVVLLVPMSNPDGVQMIVEWYRKYVGTPYEGGFMPWLTHHYAGHDNNRDWFMLNLPETRALTRVLYHDWLPQIMIDEHQMEPMGARLFVPPFMDPALPHVQPLLWRNVGFCGAAMARDLQETGLKGIIQEKRFTGWWIGACHDTAWLHNTVGLISETAEIKVATPIDIGPGEIEPAYAAQSMALPDPWPGGIWRLRDIVDYELAATFSLIRTASLHREHFLIDSYLMSKAGIETRPKDQPFAFVVPARQPDPPTTRRMIGLLLDGAVEVHRAEADFSAGGRTYPAGSFVVLMAQPCKAYAWALLDRQKYPDMRLYPGGPPIPPYDNAGWTLPLQMGVACDRIDTPFEAPLRRIDKTPSPDAIAVPTGAAYVALDSRPNASYAVAFALLGENAEIWRTRTDAPVDGGTLPAGSFLVKTSPSVLKALPGLLEKYGVPATGLDAADDIPKAPLKRPRIALYRSWQQNRDEGWTRYVLDDLGIPYTTLRNEDFRGTKSGKAGLRALADVIVFADEDAEIIRTGKAGSGDGLAHFPLALPPEYEGGIAAEGVEALKSFVAEGGRLVALNRACGLVLEEFGPPARDILKAAGDTAFFCPTSILQLDVDNTTPLGFGFSDKVPAVFSKGPVLETWVPPAGWGRRVVASFAKDGVLLSGWIRGEDVISGRAAVVDCQWKKGRIVLIGIRAQHRAQSHGTYKFLLNALLYPEL